MWLKYFFTTLTLFLHFSWCLSQSHKLDSLEALLSQYPHEDSARAALLKKLGFAYLDVNPDKALGFAEKSLSIFKKLQIENELAAVLNNIGQIYRSKSEYKKALEYHTQSLLLCGKNDNKKEAAGNYTNIGIVQEFLGNYQQALEYHIKALKIQEAIGNIKGISACNTNMGIIYLEMNNFSKARECFENTLQADKELGDKKGLASALINLGNVYASEDQYETTLKYYFEGLAILQDLGEKADLASTLNNIGEIYNYQGDLEKALEYHSKSLELKKEMGNKRGISLALNNIADIFSKQKKFLQAAEYSKRSLDMAKEIASKDDVKEAYHSLSESFAGMNDYRQAYEYHKLYSETKDSLLNEESSKQIAEMQTKYETEKKEQQITLLNKDKELQDAQLNRQKIIIWSVAGGLLVVLILSIFIFRERRKSEKLLLNILPAETARELKRNGKATARHYESVTVMFTDFKGFTTIAEKLSAEELVSELDFLFKKFDEIISKYNIEKIKTIGDAYMCASGIPSPNSNHAEEIVKAGLEIQNWMIGQNGKWKLRMGIHTGPVTAGVVGDKKFAYDIWGDTVNMASRMESSGEPGRVNVSGATYEKLKDQPGLQFTFRGKISAKNKGEIDMYFVEKVLS